MSKIDEIDGIGGSKKANPIVQQYMQKQAQMAAEKMAFEEAAKRAGHNTAGANGSGEINGEKKQTFDNKLGYNLDGQVVNVGSHIGELKEQSAGDSNDNGTGGSKGDFVEKAKIHSAKNDPLALAFPDFKTKQQVGQVAKAYEKAGVEMVKDGKATNALNTLMSIGDEINSADVIHNIHNNG